jgi:hypothetical protein
MTPKDYDVEDYSHSAEQLFEFTVYLAKVSEMTDEVAEKLYEAGCDDGLVGSSEGRSYVTFSREAASQREAIGSALGDIKKAGFDWVSIELPRR